MQDSLFRKVKEATYLTTEKAWVYRPILRYFYIQHERMREFLFPEEIYEHLREFPHFSDYTLESLHLDLEQLVGWGNLVARQEMSQARTIQEFKKKRFRYQCTPYTVEFERMMLEMERMGEKFGGSLEKTQFQRLYQVLQRISAVVLGKQNETGEECAQLWEDAMTYFRQITKNTSDYIAYIHSEEVADRMQTEAFLVYKDQFTTYLRDFIVALQRTALQIQDLLASLKEDQLTPFFKNVFHHQQLAFRIDSVEHQDLLADPLDEFRGKWRSLRTWFLGNEHGESEYEMLQTRTNEAIRRITRIVQRLGERQQQFRSRKRDYLHLAKWFDQLGQINEAHRLSAAAFGVFHTRHLHVDHDPTENIYTDVWEEAPMVHRTNPRIRQYREKTRAGAIESMQERKEQLMRMHLEERQREQTVIQQYIQNDEIRVEQLPIVEPFVRKLLLSWLGKAMSRTDRTIKTEFGTKLKVVIDPSKKVILQSSDGELEMPEATYYFMKEES